MSSWLAERCQTDGERIDTIRSDFRALTAEYVRQRPELSNQFLDRVVLEFNERLEKSRRVIVMGSLKGSHIVDRDLWWQLIGEKECLVGTWEIDR